MTAEQAAGLFGIKQHWIFRLIESGAIHSTETGKSAVLICLTSLSGILDQLKIETLTLKAGEAAETDGN